MKLSIAAYGALIALAALATSADARMAGGGTMSASRVSTPSTHVSVSSPGDSRHNNWKKPINSDGGGPSDPDPKPTTKGTGGGTTVTGGYYPPHHHPGYGYGPYFPGYQQNPPLACKGRPVPCP